jgi:hypothetical protein
LKNPFLNDEALCLGSHFYLNIAYRQRNGYGAKIE